MNTIETDNSAKAGSLGPFYRSAVISAWIAAVFSAVVLSLIVVSHIRGTVREARLELQIEDLRARAKDSPADPNAIIEQIRAADMRFRQTKFRRLAFVRTGAYLLLGGLLAFVGAVKWAGTYRKVVPVPDSRPPTGAEQIRQAVLARWSVVVVLLLAVATVAVLVMLPRVDFGPGAEAQGPAYPTAEQFARNWHRFRGPGGAGIAPDANFPDDWDGPSGRNILWKQRVPVAGHNSPVVWEDRVFVSGGDPNVLQVFCFDANSGDILWTGDVERTRPRPGDEEFEVMEDTGYAACTMATDGRRVFAIFITGDLACFDFHGRALWTNHLGLPDNVYGYASSLEVYKNLVLVQFDQADAGAGRSRLIAFETASGRMVWQAKRPVANSWSSPILAQTDTGPQVITAADPWVIAYEPETGAEIWRAKCLSGDIAPSPVYAAGMVFVIEPYSKLTAIRTDGRADVTKTHIVWNADEPSPDICSPLATEKFVFILNTDGLALCFNPADGKKLWEAELENDFLASPSLVGDKLYLLTEKGTMIIAQALPQYKELKKCQLGERCHASPAFVNGRIYIRGTENLYCIGAEKPRKP